MLGHDITYVGPCLLYDGGERVHNSLGDSRTPVLALNDIGNVVDTFLVSGEDILNDAPARRWQFNLYLCGKTDVVEESAHARL